MSYGQGAISGRAGNSTDTNLFRGSVRVDEALRLKLLPNTHALGVLTTDVNGIIKLDTLSEATGVTQGVLDDSCSAIRADFPAAGGTVTDVGTGYGLSGGPITASGTIVADTLKLATRLRVQKGIDSITSIGYITGINSSNVTTALGYTPVTNARTLTINGTTYDLTANRTWSVGTVTNIAFGWGFSSSSINTVGTAALDTYLVDTRAWRQKGIDSITANFYPNSNPSGYTSNTGTVTSVATNTGTGITGGTITSSGTIAADTVILATRLRVQKAVDSLNTVIATKGTGSVTSVATGYGVSGGTITTSGTIVVDTVAIATRLRVQKAVDSLNTVIATKGSGTVTSVAAGYGTTFTTITASGSVVVDTNKASGICTNLWRQKAVDSLNTLIAAKGAGTVTNVIGGTNISITGTSTIQPTVNITGTIAVANGGTGTTATTSVNTTPITYGSNNTITVPISTGVTGLGSGVATWAATPSSANLASALTDESGTGVAVFNDKPTFKGTIQTSTAVAASAFDGSTGNMFTRTLTSSQTFTQSNFSTGQNFIVVLTQGSGTTYNPTWWSGITWVTSGGTPPTMTTTSNGITTYGFTCTGSNTFLGYLVATQ